MAVIDYAEDDDPCTSPDGNAGAKRVAFALTGGDETLLWRGEKDFGRGFAPYVIKSTRGAIKDPKAFELSFLKIDGSFGAKSHTIDLDDENVVWRGLPSTLEGLSDATPYAFLFLTERLEELRPDLWKDGDIRARESVGADEIPGAGGNGKWPRGAGMIMVRAEQLEEIVQRAVRSLLQELKLVNVKP